MMADVAPYVVTQPRRNRPVVLWAVVGFGFILLQVWIYGRWLAGGDLRRTPVGPSEVPTYTRVLALVYQPLGVVLLAVFLYRVVMRPWRRAGHLTLDGRLCLAFVSVYWQDPLINYFQTWATYNTYFWNVGSWAQQIPGWQSPGAKHFAEPIVMFLPAYIYGVFGLAIIGSKLMGRARRRWNLTPLGTYGVGLVLFFLADLLLEVPWVLFGFDAFGGSPRDLTLFSGSPFQIPLWEPLLFCPAYALWAYLRLSGTDDDVTFAESGIDRVVAYGWKRTLVKILALIGAVNAIFLIYQIPVAILGNKAEQWPTAIQEKSYFTNTLCGTGTDYACSGRREPIPQPHSAHVAPNGYLVPAA